MCIAAVLADAGELAQLPLERHEDRRGAGVRPAGALVQFEPDARLELIDGNLPRRCRAVASAPLPTLEEVRTMLAETVREWTEQWVEQVTPRAAIHHVAAAQGRVVA